MKLKKYKLGELCIPNETGIYGIPAPAEDYSDEKIRYLRISDISDDGILQDNDKKSVSDDEIQKYILKKNDIVFARTGNSTGRAYLYNPSDGELAFAGFLIKYRLDELKVNPIYIRYFTISEYYKRWVRNLSVGSTRGNISAQTFADCPIILPSRQQQNLLATTLEAIDKKIALNRAINQNLEAIPKLLYDKWFVQFDFPNEEDKPYKNSCGGMTWSNVFNREIPIGWETKKMHDISLIRRGASPRPIDKFMDDTHKGMPWLKISDATINDSPFVVSIKEHIISEGVSKSVEIEEGTLVVTNSATPGLPKFIQERCCVHDGWLVLTEYRDEMKFYLYYVLDNMRKALERMASGSIFKNLRTDYLQNYYVLVPPKELLRRFSEIVEPIMQEALRLSLEKESLIKQRDELLPLLMNGQVSLNSDLSHD